MAAIPRVVHKIFGLTGPSTKFVQFGSTVGGSPVQTKDLASIAGLAAWLAGWQDSVIGALRAPSMQEMNAVQLYHSTQVGYLFQSGIPEWETGTTYFIGSVVRVGAYWYQALQDNFSAQMPPAAASNAYWNWVNQPGLATGVIAEGGGYNAPAGWGLCDGGTDTRAGQASLFAFLTVQKNGTTANGSPIVMAIGTTAGLGVGHFVEGAGIPADSKILTVDGPTQVTLDHNASASATVSIRFSPWGLGDGSTTFNRPNMVDKVSYGAGGTRAIGTTGGAESVTLTAAQSGLPAHTHTTPTLGALGGYGPGNYGGNTYSPGNISTNGQTPATAPASAPHSNMPPFTVVPKIIKY
jgi:microcystin-dependent protein